MKRKNSTQPFVLSVQFVLNCGKNIFPCATKKAQVFFHLQLLSILCTVDFELLKCFGDFALVQGLYAQTTQLQTTTRGRTGRVYEIPQYSVGIKSVLSSEFLFAPLNPVEFALHIIGSSLAAVCGLFDSEPGYPELLSYHQTETNKACLILLSITVSALTEINHWIVRNAICCCICCCSQKFTTVVHCS